MDLVLHEHTNDQVKSFIDNPSHALILIGQNGAGKGHLAKYIASQLLNLDSDELNSYPFYSRLEPADNIIAIESIRKIQKFVQLKSIGSKEIRRVLILDDSHLMTTEAQNAFLKILEEPPEDTVIIMSAISDKSLLSTIFSRAQSIHVKNPSLANVTTHYKNIGFFEDEIKKNYYVGDGGVGLINSLLNNESDHPLVNSIAVAKSIVSASMFDRLVIAESLSKQKDQVPDVLFALKRVYRAVMVQAGESGGITQIKRSHNALSSITDSEALLSSSTNTKLLLTDLFLNI